eukprot:gene10203-19069_t
MKQPKHKAVANATALDIKTRNVSVLYIKVTNLSTFCAETKDVSAISALIADLSTIVNKAVSSHSGTAEML